MPCTAASVTRRRRARQWSIRSQPQIVRGPRLMGDQFLATIAPGHHVRLVLYCESKFLDTTIDFANFNNADQVPTE